MIHLSHAAITEINRLKSRHSNPDALFRLGIKTGGCADLYYTMEFDEDIAPQDQVWVCDGVRVVVALNSLGYVNGLTLDYSEDLMGGGFRFHNPNAVHSCGCGNSFSIAQSK